MINNTLQKIDNIEQVKEYITDKDGIDFLSKNSEEVFVLNVQPELPNSNELVDFEIVFRKAKRLGVVKSA